MKVLVASPFAVMPATFETDLEIVQSHLDQDDQVTVLGCDAALPACYPNPPHAVGLCMHCVSRRHAGLRLLSRPVDDRPLIRLQPEDHAEIGRLPREFSDLDALRALTIGDFDLGWGVLSSLVSITRDPMPDVKVHADLIRRLMLGGAAVYRSVQRHIDELMPDRVYVFNGRFSETRAVLRAAHSRKVDCFMQDRGSSFRHYALFKNRLAHDPQYFQDLIREVWAAGDPEERAIMGASFFIESSQGVSHFMQSYVSDQVPAALPPDWDPSRNNVAVYTSSDDEFAGIGDVMINPLYPDQYQGLARIFESLRDDQSLHLYVRMHPNARTMRDTLTRELARLRQSNVTVVAPESPLSTYALMRAADRVLTFGSTTGIEAVYWGKPSILANVSYYDSLGATYNPRSHEETLALLRQPSLPAKDKTGALMFGYFTRVYGLRFRHFQPTGLPGGPFRGVQVRPSPLVRLSTRLVPLLPAAGRLHRQLIEARLTGRLA
jgi:hypothetical protein